jgi:hypothetical protein
MKDLHIGDMIQVGSDKYDPIYSFGHYIPDARVEYAVISAQALDSPLCVSWNHLLHVEGNMVTASITKKKARRTAENAYIFFCVSKRSA